jgi:hypothetical protein
VAGEAAAQVMPSRGTTNQRGYTHQHRALRAAMLPRAYGTPCVRCGEAMLNGQLLDLDHNDNRDGYRGFAHSSCNRRAGGEQAQRERQRQRFNPKPRSATRW